MQDIVAWRTHIHSAQVEIESEGSMALDRASCHHRMPQNSVVFSLDLNEPSVLKRRP